MPLTRPQREHLAKRLREERARVLRALGRGDGAFAADAQGVAVDLSRGPSHSANQGTGTFDREPDGQDVSRLTRELEEIGAALERLFAAPERFGYDERTGEEIPFERLDLIPWTRERAGDPSASAAERRAAETDLRAAEHNERYAG